MYHEGWWGPFYIRLIYLIPGTAFLALTLVAIKWPQFGGWLIVIFGGLFTIMFMDIHIVESKLSVDRDLTGSLVSAPLGFLGILLLMMDNHIRHLLVMDEGKLVGMISIGDVIKDMNEELGFHIEQLTNYFSGLRKVLKK